MQKKSTRASRESALASGWTVEGAASEAAEAAAALPATAESVDEIAAAGAETPGAPDTLDDAPDDESAKPQISNGALVSLGVFGGVYLLYTVGWFIVAQAYSSVNAMTAAGSGSIGGVLQQIVFWAAPVAPALWFFTALALSRGKRSARLAILLAIGAIVLLPLPMLITRGA